MANVYDPLAGLRIADEHLERVLRGQDFLVADGGMGTMLQAAGLAMPGKLPDLLCLEQPEAITAIQAQYVAAGSEVITTNTFSANRNKLDGAAEVADVYKAAAACARAAGGRSVFRLCPLGQQPGVRRRRGGAHGADDLQTAKRGGGRLL